MYHVIEELATALAAKRLYLKVVCEDTTLAGDWIASCAYNASIGGTERVTIGGVTSARV